MSRGHRSSTRRIESIGWRNEWVVVLQSTPEPRCLEHMAEHTAQRRGGGATEHTRTRQRKLDVLNRNSFVCSAALQLEQNLSAVEAQALVIPVAHT